MRILIAAALLAGSSSIAAAQCAPADLAGSWSLIGSNGGTWVICPLRSTPRACWTVAAVGLDVPAAATRSRAFLSCVRTAASQASGRSRARTRRSRARSPRAARSAPGSCTSEGDGRTSGCTSRW